MVVLVLACCTCGFYLNTSSSLFYFWFDPSKYTSLTSCRGFAILKIRWAKWWNEFELYYSFHLAQLLGWDRSACDLFIMVQLQFVIIMMLGDIVGLRGSYMKRKCVEKFADENSSGLDGETLGSVEQLVVWALLHEKKGCWAARASTSNKRLRWWNYKSVCSVDRRYNR